MKRNRRLTNTKSSLVVLLAIAMVLFLFPTGAAADISGDDYSVGFKGQVVNGYWWTHPQSPDVGLSFQFRIADGRLLDEGERGKGDPGQIVEFYGNFITDNQCESWFIRGADRFNEAFPYDKDTGEFDISLNVGVEHQLWPMHPTEPYCDYQNPVVHNHFYGTLTINVVLTPAEKCPKKGPNSGCVRSNSLTGNLTVTTGSGTPFDGTRTTEDFGRTGWDSHNYTTTWYWREIPA